MSQPLLLQYTSLGKVSAVHVEEEGTDMMSVEVVNSPY